MNDNGIFRPAAAIFDMDGLLLDTEKPAIPLWTRAGESFGWKISPQLVIRTLGLNGAKTRAIFFEELGPELPYDRIKEEFSRLYDEEFEKGIALKRGLIVLLEHLAARNIPAAVATSTRVSGTRWKLGKAGILDRFTALACGDEVVNGKPAPDIFLLAAERLGKKPSECAGFEDSPAGLEGLYAAGIPSVFIKDMAQPSLEILSTVWRSYKDLEEAVELFE